MKVISRKLWTPREFVEAITDKCYAIDGDNDSIVEALSKIKYVISNLKFSSIHSINFLQN